MHPHGRMLREPGPVIEIRAAAGEVFGRGVRGVGGAGHGGAGPVVEFHVPVAEREGVAAVVPRGGKIEQLWSSGRPIGGSRLGPE